MRKSALEFLTGMAALVLAGPLASATLVPVTNADFSDPMLAPGAYTTYQGAPNLIPGWTNPNIAGVQNNTEGDNTTLIYPGGIPGGTANFAYDDGGTIAQTLTSKLQVGTYVLDVYLGWRIGKSFGGGSIQLSAGSDSTAQNLVQPAMQGTFLLQTLTVTVLPGDTNLGQPLSISLNSSGNSIDFADVSLSFTPEPGSLAVLSVAGMCVVRRRRRTV